MIPNHIATELRSSKRKWLVTGVAGFIGSHLLEALLNLDQSVVGVDNFSTGKESNLKDVQDRVGGGRWARFQMLVGDLAELKVCKAACAGVDLILHQAALGSVPRSLARPLDTHAANVDGFVNLLAASKDAGIKRFVFASSSSGRARTRTGRMRP